ncbi:flavin reductase family protein [Nocardioides sp.]|uniref:flavin reductase family protein n=1 Tax=Nocardioides sp. TaxID=35761 RepID=UPI003D0FCE32
MSIHSSNPFLDPSPDQARRLRGRLGGAVSLWTSGSGPGRAGLTVSSIMVATGEPAQVVALVDPDGDLLAALTDTGRAVVQLLEWRHRQLAEMFAGQAPAPGGMFAQATFVETDWGPLLEGAGTWAGVALDDSRVLGWSQLVQCTVEHLVVGPDSEPLLHRRGRYERPAG